MEREGGAHGEVEKVKVGRGSWEDIRKIEAEMKN